MHRLHVPLFSLIAGVALGYLISNSQYVGQAGGGLTTHGAQASSVTGASSASGTGLAVTDKASKKEEEDKKEKDKTNALAASLDDLIAEFNTKRARRQFEGLTLDDIQWSLRYLGGKKGDASENSVRAELMRAWAKIDAPAAWKAALQMTDEDARSSCIAAVAGELAKTNPDAAIKLALSLGMTGDRADVLRAIFNDWGKINLGAAMAYWNSHPDLPTDSYAMSGALYEAANKNPQQAAQMALQLGSSNARQNALSSALGKWFKKDPAAALDWAQKLTDPAMRDSALSGLLQQQITSNPQEALMKLDLMSSPDARRDALRSAMYSWIRKDPAAAMDFLASDSALAKDESLYWSIGNSLEGLTYQERNAMLARLPEGESKNQVVANLAQSYAYNGNYTQAVTVLNDMPDSSNRDYALHNIGQEWGKKNPRGAAAWLDSQPDSSDRDLATAGYIAAIAGSDPQGALQWAATIPDQDILKTVYRNIAARWLASDPKAAQGWFNNVTLLSDAEKKSILAEAGKRLSTYLPTVNKRR